jgi:ribosomal subunit interface protein
MRFVIHSPGDTFTDALREYCELKLTKPIERHQVDGDAVSMDVDATSQGEGVAMKVRLRLPHFSAFTVHADHDDAYACIDLVADKLERQVREAEDKRRSARRRRALEAGGEALDQGEDIFTEDEEGVLKEMGALDAVLNV